MANRLVTSFDTLSPRERLRVIQGGSGSAGEPSSGLGAPQVVNTAGNPLGLAGAIGGVPGTVAQAAIPGMGLGAALGRGFRSLAGGPHGVVTPGIGPRPNVGTPQFQALIDAISQAQALNNRAENFRQAFAAGKRSSPRGQAAGRRGARERGRGGGAAENAGGFGDPGAGVSRDLDRGFNAGGFGI